MGKMKKLKEQPAYAGSRVDYDIPSLEKIGSGEGNQAHGWGLYYAKSKKVANDYYKTFKKQTPSHFEYNGKNMYIALQDMLDIEFMNGETLEVIIKTSEKAKSISELKELLVVNLTKLNKKYKYNVNEKNKVEQAIKIIPTLNDNEFSIIKPQLHQVELPEDEYLLNEQEMLIDQSEYVQIIIYKINKELGLGIEDSGIRGLKIYELISDKLGSDKKASLYLNKKGIKGISYDGRQDGRCFVIFNPDDVKVVDKLIKEEQEIDEQIAYCGALKPFDKADIKLIGKGNNLLQHGYGFYFTADKETADFYRRGHTLNGLTGGAIMTVELPEDKYFIDEDKEEQSEYVYKRLIKLYNSKILSKEIVERNKKLNLDPISGTGKEIYEEISNNVGGSKKASELLANFGIKGITYISRTDGKCFVIFNPNDVKVVDKLIKESVQYVNNIEVLINPSKQELNQILKESKELELRIIYHISLGKLYAWDSSRMVHSEMSQRLGIEWNTNDNFYLVYDDYGFHMRTRSESEFLISDYQEYKEIANEIDHMQVFKQYTQRLSAFDNLIQDIKEYLEYFPQKLNMEHIYNKKNYNEIIKDLDLQTINESAESDLKQRNEAKEIFKEISKKIKNKNTDILISERICFIDITNEIKKIINQDNRKHFIRFVFSGDESVFSYNVSIGNKDTMFTFPILEKPVLELITKLVNKSKSNIEKYYQVMNDSNKKMEFIKDLLRKYIVSHIKLKLEYDFPVFIHEIIHYLDDIRRTSTYKPKAQTFNSKQDYIDYYNNPIEQNAYYQETISIFDDWIENKWLNDDNLGSSWKDFEKFYSEFVRQYRGRYDILSDKNKHKIMKRAYLYWKSKISATVNEGYVKRTGKHPIYGVEYNDDYIDYEVGMRYIDDKGIEWEIIKTSGEGDDKIILVQDENGKINHTDQMMLNIHIMDDEDDFRMIFDPKYFSDEDIKNSEN